MNSAFLVLTTVLFIGAGTFAVLTSEVPSLALILLLVTIAHSFIFRSQWGSLARLTQAGSLIAGLGGLCLIAVAPLFYAEPLLNAARFIAAGLISLVLFLPTILDTTLALISRSERSSPGLFEALPLFRNLLLATTLDVWFGYRSCLPSRKKGLRSRLSSSFLLAVTLSARIASISSNLLTATYVRNFRVNTTLTLFHTERRRLAFQLSIGVLIFTALFWLWA